MKFIDKDDDIVIRIPRKLYSKEVQRLIDIVQFKKMLTHSKATQKNIDDIMVDIKRDRKKLMKPLLDKIGKM
jgi:hypothetical protein